MSLATWLGRRRGPCRRTARTSWSPARSTRTTGWPRTWPDRRSRAMPPATVVTSSRCRRTRAPSGAAAGGAAAPDRRHARAPADVRVAGAAAPAPRARRLPPAAERPGHAAAGAPVRRAVALFLRRRPDRGAGRRRLEREPALPPDGDARRGGRAAAPGGRRALRSRGHDGAAGDRLLPRPRRRHRLPRDLRRHRHRAVRALGRAAHGGRGLRRASVAGQARRPVAARPAIVSRERPQTSAIVVGDGPLLDGAPGRTAPWVCADRSPSSATRRTSRAGCVRAALFVLTSDSEGLSLALMEANALRAARGRLRRGRPARAGGARRQREPGGGADARGLRGPARGAPLRPGAPRGASPGRAGVGAPLRRAGDRPALGRILSWRAEAAGRILRACLA